MSRRGRRCSKRPRRPASTCRPCASTSGWPPWARVASVSSESRDAARRSPHAPRLSASRVPLAAEIAQDHLPGYYHELEMKAGDEAIGELQVARGVGAHDDAIRRSKRRPFPRSAPRRRGGESSVRSAWSRPTRPAASRRSATNRARRSRFARAQRARLARRRSQGPDCPRNHRANLLCSRPHRNTFARGAGKTRRSAPGWSRQQTRSRRVARWPRRDTHGRGARPRR